MSNQMFRAMIAAALMLMGLSACVSVNPVISSVEIINKPPLGETSQAELGDTIVEKGRVTTTDGIHIDTPVVIKFGLAEFTIPEGSYRAVSQDKDYEYYIGKSILSHSNLTGTNGVANGEGVCIDKNNSSVVGLYNITGECQFKSNVGSKINHVRVSDDGALSFRQELIYNGRVGNSIKFLYREFSGDIVRPAFTQDIQYDLADGSTIGFKGVRIEIIGATNTKISYRVLASFPDPAN